LLFNASFKEFLSVMKDNWVILGKVKEILLNNVYSNGFYIVSKTKHT